MPHSNHSKFGNAELKCGAQFGEFGKTTLKSTFLAGLALFLLAIAAFAINMSLFTDAFDFSMPLSEETPSTEDSAAQEQAHVAMQAMAMLSSLGAIALLAYLVLFAFGAYLKTAIDNLMWNNTTLASQHRFKSTASPIAATWIDRTAGPGKGRLPHRLVPMQLHVQVKLLREPETAAHTVLPVILRTLSAQYRSKVEPLRHSGIGAPIPV